MDERARAILDEAHETLSRIADVKVIPREHRYDGLLADWSETMPTKAPTPTADDVAEIATMIVRAELAKLLPTPTDPETEQKRAEEFTKFINGQIEAHAKVRGKAFAQFVVERVAKLGAELRLEFGAHAGERTGVIDLPALPLRSQRRAG